MQKTLGIIILAFAILCFLAVFAYAIKRGIYKGDFLGLIIDSIEFIVLIIALIFLGVILLTEK